VGRQGEGGMKAYWIMGEPLIPLALCDGLALASPFPILPIRHPSEDMLKAGLVPR